MKLCDLINISIFTVSGDLYSIDVCLQAEVLPIEAVLRHQSAVLHRRFASVLPRSHIFCLASTRGIGTYKLRYDITIYPSVIFFMYVFHTLKTKLHLCLKQRVRRVRVKLNLFGVCYAMNLVDFPNYACHRLHGFLTALLRTRQFCLGLGLSLGLVTTASLSLLLYRYTHELFSRSKQLH